MWLLKVTIGQSKTIIPKINIILVVIYLKSTKTDVQYTDYKHNVPQSFFLGPIKQMCIWIGYSL